MTAPSGEAVTQALARLTNGLQQRGHRYDCIAWDGLKNTKPMHHGCNCGYHEAQNALPVLRAALEAGAKDTQRLDWLQTQRSDITEVETTYRQISDDEAVPEQEQVLVGHSWGLDGQYSDVREAIDAARSPSAEEASR